MDLGALDLNKYRNHKVYSDGMMFDSRKEARRYHELLLLQKTGKIRDLQRQVPFLLLPDQREPDTIGKRGGVHKGRIIERKTQYIADFCYYDCESGQTIVEDTKGFRTPEYRLKKKMMLYFHGIRIREI
jgi:hypothetical protein